MAHADPQAARDAVPPHRPGTGPATVLVVDADADLREIYATLLVHHGYRALEAENGTVAFGLARERRPDAVVLDLDIPGVDGLEVIRLLRDDPATAPIPVILLSVRSEVRVRVEAHRAGGRGFLEKPFAPRQLLVEVQRLLGPAPKLVGPDAATLIACTERRCSRSS